MLVVDDHADIRALLLRILEAEGYRVILADGGKSALALLHDTEVDCILLDLNMPHMDGVEVLRRLRQDGRPWLPVMVLTGSEASDDRRAALEAGAEDLLSKPFDRLELAVRIRNLLRLKASQDELVEANAHLERLVANRTRQAPEPDRVPCSGWRSRVWSPPPTSKPIGAAATWDIRADGPRAPARRQGMPAIVDGPGA